MNASSPGAPEGSDPRMPADPDMLERFRQAWPVAVGDRETAAERLPALLAEAARTTLGADGAGISLIAQEHRVPLGSSGEDAAAAELLQFTVGEGPCLDALRSGRPVGADGGQIAAAWPQFWAALTERTRYHSVVAVPLEVAEHMHGALDLYFEADTIPAPDLMTDAHELARHLSDSLKTAGQGQDGPRSWSSAQMPDWMYGPSTRHRLRVWVAVGILMASLSLSDADAFVLLRTYAYARDENLDSVVDELVDGRLNAAEVFSSS